MDGDADTPRLFAEALRGEKDPDVATTMATFLEGSPENSVLLVECAHAHRENADVLSRLLVALGDSGTPECLLAIEELLGHPDAKVRESAEIEVRGIRPPVAGVYISQFYNPDPDVPSIQRGDIVVSRNGEPVTSWEDFHSSLGSGPSSATTTLVVHRGNSLLTIEIKGPKFVSGGNYVSPGQ